MIVVDVDEEGKKERRRRKKWEVDGVFIGGGDRGKLGSEC